MLDGTAVWIAKAIKTNRALLRRNSAAVDARSNALASAIQSWLDRYAKKTLAIVRARLNTGGISALRNSSIVKIDIDDLDDDELELFNLLRKYGLQEIKSSGNEMARMAGERRWIITPGTIDEITAELATKVRRITGNTQEQIRESLRGILNEALKETPMPTSREIGRRIAQKWTGEPYKPAGIRGEAAEGEIIGRQEYLFSYSRAQTIARAEIGEARVYGMAQSYEDTGIEFARWLAYPDDGRSGDRQHWKMNNHKPISVADMLSSDESRWFRLPDGTRTPYPLWSGLPAGQRVNCRCMIVPA